MKTMKFYLYALVAGLLLSGCTVTDQQRPTDIKYIAKTDPTWQQHLQKIEQIKHYQAQGQLGYISTKERFSTRFDWQYQDQQHYILKLYSTLSSDTLQIQMQPQGMTISDNKGRQRSATDAKLLLREIIGMDFPLSQFAFWLKGQPKDTHDYFVTENHFLGSFIHQVEGRTWTADYLSYQLNQQPPMPQNILLKTDGQTLKIRVDEWNIK